MRLLLLSALGLLVLCDAPVRSASVTTVNEVPMAERQKKKKKTGAQTGDGRVNGVPAEETGRPQTQPGSQAVAAGDPFPKAKVRVYEGGLAQMAHPPSASHGVLTLTKDGYQAAAIAFKTETNKSQVLCSRGQSPYSPTIGACRFYHWISKVPGGAPVSPGCMEGPFNASIASTLEAVGTENPANGFTCRLPAGFYYCNIYATGWDHPEQPAQTCGGLVASPMIQQP